MLEEAAAWQSRGLEATYAIVFFDAIRVKIRNEGVVNNRAVYLAIGVRCSGHKEILGLWIEQTEGAKFWLRVMTELRNRGTQDILIAVVDGLKGFPEAITSVFPRAVVQTCNRASHPLLDALRRVEGTPAGGAGASNRSTRPKRPRWRGSGWKISTAAPWGQKYPAIAQSWRRNWEQVIPFFAFAPELRKILYTTNGSRALTRRSARQCGCAATFPVRRPPPSSSGWCCVMCKRAGKIRRFRGTLPRPSLAIQFEDRFLLTD